MRTTLTIDDDVAFGLKREREEDPKKSFKDVVNEVLRRGLTNKPEVKKQKKFKVKAFNLGLRKDLNFDNIEDLLEVIEGPNRR